MYIFQSIYYQLPGRSHMASLTELVQIGAWVHHNGKKKSGHNSDFTATIPAAGSIEEHYAVPQEKIRGLSRN